jgi:hypothetical protein
MITCKAVCACKLALFVLRCVEARSSAVYPCVNNLMHTLQSLMARKLSFGCVRQTLLIACVLS